MTVTLSERQRLAHAMSLLVANRAKVGYIEHRPMRSAHIGTIAALEAWLKAAAPKAIRIDCSEAVTLVFHAAGLKPPSGPKYGWAYGNTKTMEQHLDAFEHATAARIGSIVIFHTPDHAAIVAEPGADPILFSHGNQHGPQFLRLSAEQPYHRGPTTLLSIQSLG